MPGTILSAASKERIADCHITSIAYITDRAGLTAVYKAARYALVKGPQFDRVTEALTQRAKDLGIYKERGTKNA